MGISVIKAPGKINLAIDVLDRREDGYHNIDMVTIPVKLHDSIEITPVSSQYSTTLLCDDPKLVCDESNLAYQALAKMKETFTLKDNYRLYIHKKIPVEAGLGGGSADAAAIINGIAQYLPKDEVSSEKLSEIALSIGADVPFCLDNKPARVKGIGEKLYPIKVAYPYYVLIVKPHQGLSTGMVYKDFDLYKDKLKKPNIERLIRALEIDDEEEMKLSMANVLTAPAVKCLPLIGSLLEEMEMYNLPLNGMSGSGSACFALSKDKKLLEKVSKTFENENYLTYLTQFSI